MQPRQEKKPAPARANRAWRWGLQAGFFFLFLVLFACMHYPWRPWLPVRLYLDLDPLVPAASLSGSRHFLLPALIMLLAALAFGRWFCGYACPLGFLIDLFDLSTGGKGRGVDAAAGEGNVAPGRKGGRAAGRPVRWFRGMQWVALALVALGVLLGNGLPLALDPLSLLTRSLTVNFYPVAVGVANFLLNLFRPLAEELGWASLAYLSFSQPAFYASLGSLLLLLAVLGLGLIEQRFWCRHLCPLGALLGLLGRAALFRRRVAASCTDCGRCVPSCPMGAIAVDPRATEASLCLQCRTCAALCPTRAVSFAPGSAARPRSLPASPGLSRRSLFLGLGAGSMSLVLTRLDPRVMKNSLKGLRPPGAIPEQDFLAACIRCGACVRICVTHTLQAAGMEDGLIRWGTPTPNLRFAGCEQQCNLCGQVCPTGAVRALSLVERQHAKIGTAVISRDLCVAWAEERLCLLCDEACPYNAIVFKRVRGHKRPFVDLSRCNGCGMCEQVCPVNGEAAIVVKVHGELRLKSGSYCEALNRQRVFLVPERDSPYESAPYPEDGDAAGEGGA